MNEEEKDKRIERLELVKKCLDAEINMLRNNLEEEKEKNNMLLKVIKKLEEEKEGFKRSYEIVMEEKANDYFLMSKVIDIMATFIGNEDIDEMICKNVDECYRDNEDGDYFPCKACIKEYYFKKARGE